MTAIIITIGGCQLLIVLPLVDLPTNGYHVAPIIRLLKYVQNEKLAQTLMLTIFKTAWKKCESAFSPRFYFFLGIGIEFELLYEQIVFLCQIFI